LLANYGMDLEASIFGGYSPLQLDDSSSSEGAIYLPLGKGARKNIRDDASRTALELGAEKRHLGIIRLLVNRGAEVDARTADGRTPLHLAVRNSEDDVVRLLLEFGADAAARDADGVTLLDVVDEEMKTSEDPARWQSIRAMLVGAGARDD
ncbi:ankyrin, partial [Schizophyllum commune H4-8]|uniref:ankyrin n=1 Tax=Schizophyllum commune (strain H4-8 / FGSC 9210) TaxID=578458 RepID=UPI00215FCC1B